MQAAAASTDTGAGAVSYAGRERMLGYSKVSKAEKVRRRLAILEAEAGKYIKEFEEAVEEGASPVLA